MSLCIEWNVRKTKNLVYCKKLDMLKLRPVLFTLVLFFDDMHSQTSFLLTVSLKGKIECQTNL